MSDNGCGEVEKHKCDRVTIAYRYIAHLYAYVLHTRQEPCFSAQSRHAAVFLTDCVCASLTLAIMSSSVVPP